MNDNLETLLRAVEERHQFYAEDKLFYCTTAEDVPALVQALRASLIVHSVCAPHFPITTARAMAEIIDILTPKGGAR